ncbi:sigma-70 family RNA polymerase sigma factor [Pseudoalteromonas sp. C8]|uniref:RNA polymerase sigma factor n=1 Tax=Pseudoalteromonas sp. C8 TaxID=2686345 RepID=UPI0013FD4F8D|nr:sigma-70 family RNA polymerase sigma factor [Pseudoalteromonas sp. C8]
MKVDNKELAKYMLLIKKITNWKVRDLGHKNLIEDIVQETFIKLFKQGFLEKNSLDTEDEQKMATAYIKQTVHSCYMDLLASLGINRRLTKAERLNSENKYENIKNDHIDDVDENELTLVETDTPEQQLFVKEAYQWIKNCYLSLLDKVNDQNRKTFFEAAFWQFSDYDMSLKALAEHLGYGSSNPTQELKRFVEKVSLCTQPHGVIVNNPNEQIQFLREQMENSKAHS